MAQEHERTDAERGKDLLEAFNAGGVVDHPGELAEDEVAPSDVPYAKDADAPAPPG